MQTKELIAILQTKNLEQEIEYLIIDEYTKELIAANLTNKTCDPLKVFKAFHKRKLPKNNL